MKKTFILLALLLVVVFMCAQNSYGWDQNDIIGYWKSDNGAMSVKIEKAQDSDAYILYNQKDSYPSKIGDVNGEVIFRPTTATWSYLGRHTFFGSMVKEYKWGKDGGLGIEIIDHNTIRIAWLDTKWEGKWILKRQ